MIVLEECLGATGACAKDFQPAYKGFPNCLQFIYSFIKKTFGEYPGIIETEDTFGSDLTELEFHPSLLHRIWCCLRPLVLRTYLRSCPIMLHRHHFFSYRQLRLVKWKREAKHVPKHVGLGCSCCTFFSSVIVFQSSELLWDSHPKVCYLLLPPFFHSHNFCKSLATDLDFQDLEKFGKVCLVFIQTVCTTSKCICKCRAICESSLMMALSTCYRFSP